MNEEDKKFFWKILFGPFPIGSLVICRDKRFKGGKVSGRIINYFQDYAPYFYTKDLTKVRMKYLQSYEIQHRKKASIWKKPETILKVITNE